MKITRFKVTEENRGFSLPELILAAAILALALSGLLATFAYIIILNETNAFTTVALNDAEFVLEQVKAMDFDEIEAYKTALNYTPPSLSNLPGENINVAFTGDNPIQVSVSLTWTERQRQRQVNLVSQFTDLH